LKSLTIFVLLFLSLLFACNKEIPGPKEVHLQIDCRILDQDFKQLKSFQGDYCAFFPNGEWISITGKVIDLHSKTNQLRLHYPQMGHHEIKLSNDEKKIFFLSSEIREFKGKSVRFDVINISNRDGVRLNRWDLFEHIDELNQKLGLGPFEKAIPAERADENFPDNKWVFANLNAIYEIPNNNLEKKFPYMKEGNLLVTFNGLGSVVVFDPELKKIEFVYRVLKTNLFGISDGQILPNGHLLVFKNSSINEIDMQEDKPLWSFDSKKSGPDNNLAEGSVQLLVNNNFLMTDNSNNSGKVLEVNRKGEIVKTQLNDILDSRTKKPVTIYRAKKTNLSKFIENNF
jgi:hypothetical protein